MTDDRYAAFMGHGPEQIPHLEHWSCPDAETYLTGIDTYEHPRLCRQRLQELYPQLRLPVPETDDPRSRPRFEIDGISSDRERHTVRWGMARPAHFSTVRRSLARRRKCSPSARWQRATSPIGATSS